MTEEKMKRKPRQDKKKVGCDWCGKIFDKKSCEIERSKHNFCSHKCYAEWSSKNLRGEKKNTWKGGREVICFYCGKKFWLSPNKLQRNKHYFCSDDCYRVWWKKNNLGEKSPNWKRGKIKRVCICCGKDFFVHASTIDNGRGKYCSWGCYLKWKFEDKEGERKPGWKGGKIKRVCRFCGKEFKVHPNVIRRKGGVYCSKKCYLKLKSEKKKGVTKLTKICLVCGKEFVTLLSCVNIGKGKYCSKRCARQIQKFPQHHTKPELIFEEICKKNNLPFHYVGDSKLWIGKDKKLNPDFCELNGKKIVVEIFGNYWHSPLQNPKIGEEATLAFRKKHYKKYGWKSYFIWETDLMREDAEEFVLYLFEKEGIV